MMSNVLADLGHAWLAIRRRPFAMVVPVLTMAIGIGASTAIFSALYAAMFSPLPYQDAGRLVMGRATFDGEVNPWASAPDLFDYRDRNSVLQSLSLYRPSAARMTVLGDGGAESVLVTQVSWDLFRTLGISPAIGRPFSPAEGEMGGAAVALVSHGYWQRALGGSNSAIGRTLSLGARRPTIVGVMPQGFRFAFASDIWLPMQRNGMGNTVRRFHSWMMLGRLKPDVTLIQAQKQMDAISASLEKEYPDSNTNKALLLTGLQDALTEGDRPSLLILMAAVGVLLLVACADVAGLLLSRGAARESEMTIRSALGATGRQLVGQLLAESMIVALAAGSLGLLLAVALRGLVLRFVPLDSLGVTALPLGGPVLLFAFVSTLLTSALFGIVPAVIASRTNAANGLKSGSRTTEAKGRARFRHALVVIQVAMSVMLLVAATLLGRSLFRLRAIDPGFATQKLLTAEIDLRGASYPDTSTRMRFFTGLLEDVRAVPGVTHATIINSLPILDPANNIPAWDAAHPPAQTSEAPIVCARFVLPGYFQAMKIPMVAGRDVSVSDVAGPDRPPVLVISQSVGRRLFPGANPLGQRMALFTGDPEPTIAEVVGIVGDVRMNALSDTDTLAMYAPYQVEASPVMRIAVRTAGAPGAMTASLRAALAKRDRGLVLSEVKTMDEILAGSLQGFSMRAGALGLFGASALLLAMLGVYGVLAFTVNRRRPDIALRVVVGASRGDVLRWVLVRGLGPVAIGLAIGLAGALGAGRLLRTVLFDVPPTDGVAFATAGVALMAAAVAACLLPAWRAMHVDPIVALRAE